MEKNDTIIPIDTLEFIDFWDEFRMAVLNQDTAKLNPMLDSEIEGDCFLQVPDLDQSYHDWILFNNRKITKYRLLEVWDKLFINPYVDLLEKYDIRKDLFSEKDFTKKSYLCEILLGNRLYRASVYFNEDNSISYYMSFSIGHNYAHSLAIDLIFIKRKGESIKLHKIDCSA
ncbi:hypothetical protein LJB92_04535, partial [Bacteroidales bacterium OttesenSCG-928-M06]|nr:hypothetical protein [Bacteroidales bacterium OttesenSCG-928-M06]